MEHVENNVQTTIIPIKVSPEHVFLVNFLIITIISICFAGLINELLTFHSVMDNKWQCTDPQQ